MENIFRNNKIAINRLTINIVEENMKILGVITAVNAKKLIITLPGGLIGFAPVADTDSFLIGSVICCTVKQICRGANGSKSKSKIILSVAPKEIYENLSSDDVKKYLIFQGVVESKEDFGYVVDIGVSSIRAFLKDKFCEKYIQRVNKGQPLEKGEIIPCLVLKVNRQSVNLTCNPKTVTTSVFAENDIERIRAMIPGTRITATVTKVNKNGLLISIGKLVGAVSNFHLENCVKTPSDYSIGETVVGTVLYVEPLTKTIYLSLRNNLKYLMPVDNELIELRGKIVNGIVMSVNEHNLMLNIRDVYHGICQKIHFPHKEEKLHIGSEKKCRVLTINHIDHTMTVSMSKKHMSEWLDDDKTFNEIEIGDVIEATIGKIMPRGVQMNVSATISGFVPKTHFEDSRVPLEKKLELQTRIRCMVISIDESQRRLILSMKKSIVKSEYPILKSILDAEVGFISDGTLSFVHEKFVKVRFCGDVEGVVHQNALLSHNITNSKSQLEVGQTVTCKVVFCSPEENKLHLDFVDFRNNSKINRILVDKTTAKKSDIEIKNCRQIERLESGLESLKIGRSYEAEVTAIEADHLQIRFQNGVLGQVFITDVTDSITNGTNPLKSYTLGQRVNATVCVLIKDEKSNNNDEHFASCCLTKKINPNAKKTVKDFKPGQRVIGFVEKFSDNYLTMQVNRNVTGRVDILNVSQKFDEILNAAEKFKLGDGYFAFVVNIDEDMLELTLINDSQMKPQSILASKLCTSKPGIGIVVKLPCKFTGIAGLTDIRDDYNLVADFLKNLKHGELTQCLILNIDKKTKTAQVSLRQSRISCESKTDSRFPEISSVSVGQVMRGIVKEVGDNGRVTVQLGTQISGVLNLKDNENVEIHSVVGVRVDEMSSDIILVKDDDVDCDKRISTEELQLSNRKMSPFLMVGEKRKQLKGLASNGKKKKLHGFVKKNILLAKRKGWKPGGCIAKRRKLNANASFSG